MLHARTQRDSTCSPWALANQSRHTATCTLSDSSRQQSLARRTGKTNSFPLSLSLGGRRQFASRRLHTLRLQISRPNMTTTTSAIIIPFAASVLRPVCARTQPPRRSSTSGLVARWDERGNQSISRPCCIRLSVSRLASGLSSG